MKKIFTLIIMWIILAALFGVPAKGQYPGSTQVQLDGRTVPQFVDYLPHFAGIRVNARTAGNLIIKAVKTRQIGLSTGTVLSNGTVGEVPGAGMGNYFSYTISNDGGRSWTPAMWPCFTIEAQHGRKVDIKLRNELNGLTYKDVNIAVDQTIMMDGVPTIGNPMTDPYEGPIPMSLHLHGGEVQSTSNGGPDAWFTPGYAMKGDGFSMGVDSILHYPNNQDAATLWFHEHSQPGLTRVNVYAGMAGFYLLRGADEENDRLAGWSGDDLVQEVTPAGKVADPLHTGPYLPEIELVIQDRMFDTKGELFYTVEPTSPNLHPFWTPEFFGDVIVVNGKSWPYLSVAPRKYRFRMLDGSNARFYNVWLQNLATGSMGPAIVQVGVDGGLLDTPVRLDPSQGQKLLLAPGERGDIIIDFSNIAPGTVLTLMNDANAPYPSGDPVEVGTTDRIMQFVVNGQMVDKANHTKPGMDRSQIPDRLRRVPIVKLTDFLGRPAVKADIIRQLTLNEVEGEEGPAMALINNSRYTDMPEMGMFGALTENPVEGTTEIWQLINLTMDAHPIHLHLVQFQVVSRQEFDMEQYMTDYENSFTGVNGGMSNMLMGAEGPPFQYSSKNADGAIGGNLPVTPYLLGSPILPDANERGWKDVIKVYPNQVLTLIVRFAPTDLPAFLPKAFLRYGFDPAKGPGYVWHCHILEHEDNDMMRPMSVTSNPWRVREPELFALDTTIFKSTLPGSGQTSLATDLRPYSLAQNYPNPFRTETEIRFSIPEAGHIQLKLYNYMGMAVNTLIDAEAPSGNQSVILSADNLANGIYFYQLRAGDFTETKKLIVSK